MDKEFIRAMRELDVAAEEAGGYLAPYVNDDVRLDYRKISRYCKVKGIEPIDMTIRELHEFIVPQ